MVDRLACFIEEVTAHCLQRRMPQDITITQIPLSQRAVEAPERFQVTLANEECCLDERLPSRIV